MIPSRLLCSWSIVVVWSVCLVQVTVSFSPFHAESMITPAVLPCLVGQQHISIWGSRYHKQQKCSRLQMVSSQKFEQQEEHTTNARIVYQRVLSATAPSMQPLLGNLVEYIQDHFELPSRLPMVYESLPVVVEDSEESSTVLIWDSPMSLSPESTRMYVKIIAIYSDQDMEFTSIPTMAMVVVSKKNDAATATTQMMTPPSPMQNSFFMDSEKKILKALDRGLDDFVAGNVKLSGKKETHKVITEKDLKEAQDAMMAEVMEDQRDELLQHEEEVQLIGHKNANAIDAEFHREPTTTEDAAPEKSPSPAAVEDFAIQAAKQRIASLKKDEPKEDLKKEEPKEDFAIEAAKRIANKTAKSNKAKSQPEKTCSCCSPKETQPKATTTTTTRKPSLKATVGPRKKPFRTSISTPESFAKRRKEKGLAKAKLTQSPPKKAKKSLKSTKQGQANVAKAATADQSVSDLPLKPTGKSSGIKSEATSLQSKQKRRLNLNVIGSEDESVSDPLSDAPGKQLPMKQQADDEISKAADEILTAIAEEGKDMTPEELLEDVVKFGEQQDKESSTGGAFVSGAFEKAKELLQNTPFREDESQTLKDGFIENRPQDEFKSLFHAGERMANSRLEAQEKIESSDPAMMAQVDELIAAEKSISNHARVLDDELAELEILVNKSPDEELDGSPQNKKAPFFDIMSGPEVYNPNVDPETAVNWPGARPGTRNGQRLPQELKEATKQATFATEILKKIKQVDDEKGQKKYMVGNKELSQQQVENLQTVVVEAMEIGIIEDPLKLMSERSRLQMILDELKNQPDERIREIASNYKDLMLSDNFIPLIKERLVDMADRDLAAAKTDQESSQAAAHERERDLLGHLVVYAQLLLKETQALGAELEAQQLEIIRSICKVAMDPSHQTEEETAMALTDTVRDMRPMLDTMFIAYLKYAVAEEEARLARAGVLDDPEHNQWLFVLKIVQEGVYKEISISTNRYVEHIWYVLRMETPVERRMLLEKIIDTLPTLDVRPFVQVVENIVGALGESVRGDFAGATELGEMTNKLLQLRRDVKELLPPERIDLMSRDADEWAARRKKKLMEQRGMVEQRLKAARDTEHLEGEIESLGRKGEVERFD